MGKNKYYYNHKTCQYEPMRWTWKSVTVYCLGILVMGAFMFAALLFLANKFVKTAREKQLTAENEAYNKHQQILSLQLEELESTLVSLKEQDHTIHKQLFDAEVADLKEVPLQGSNAVLHADADEFQESIEEVLSASEKLLQHSVTANTHFKNRFTVVREDLNKMQQLPTLAPVKDLDRAILVSGFGVRINPFHKGKYNHQGIDFAAPRGVEIIATGPGTVTDVHRSNLQAGYGNYIEIDHGNGFVTRYAHLEALYVKQGQKLAKGARIGTVGSTGGSIAPHLHYEMTYKGKNIDPINYMIEGVTSEKYNELVTQSKNQNQSLD